MKHIQKVRAGMLALLLAGAATAGIAAPSQAATNYRSGTCQPPAEIADEGRTKMNATAWTNSNGTRTYHIAVYEDTTYGGTGFHRTTSGGVVWRGSSPSDSNPVEFYKTVSGTSTRTVTTSWTDYNAVDIAWGSISCSITGL